MLHAGRMIDAQEVLRHCSNMYSTIYTAPSFYIHRVQELLVKMHIFNGEYLQAEVLVTQLLTHVIQMFPTTHVYRGDVLMLYASVLLQLSKYHTLDMHCNEILKIYTSVYTDTTIATSVTTSTNPRLADVMLLQANIQRNRCHFTVANEMYSKVLQLARHHYTDDHLFISSVFYNQSILARECGSYTLSTSLLDQSMSIASIIFGEEHPSIYNSLHDLSVTKLLEGSYLEARKLIEQCLNSRKLFFGNYHTSTAQSMYVLGHVCYELAQYRQARCIFEGLIPFFRRTYASDANVHVCNCLAGLGNVCIKEGKHREGLLIYESVLVYRQQIYGHKHKDVNSCYYSIGECYMNMGQYDDAMRSFDNSLALGRDVFGAQVHRSIAESMYGLAHTLLLKGHLSEAKSMADRYVYGMSHCAYVITISNIQSLYVI